MARGGQPTAHPAVTASRPVAVVVLAAGRGTRFGSTKQLAAAGGGTLVRTSVESLLSAGVGEVIVVIGHDADRVREALGDLPIRTVVNDRYGDGMATSIAAGVASLAPDVAAAVVALADQPVPPGVVERLVREWHSGGCVIVAPVYAGVRGNPVLFDAVVFPELLRLSGDRGARDLLDASPERVTPVEFDFAAPPDVDQPDDLATLSEEPRGSAESRQADRSGLL